MEFQPFFMFHTLFPTCLRWPGRMHFYCYLSLKKLDPYDRDNYAVLVHFNDFLLAFYIKNSNTPEKKRTPTPLGSTHDGILYPIENETHKKKKVLEKYKWKGCHRLKIL